MLYDLAMAGLMAVWLALFLAMLAMCARLAR